MKNYGQELILDIHGCDSFTFTRKSLRGFFKGLCEEIDMQRCDLHFWDDHGVAVEDRQTEPHLKGTSAIQFIMTSNITIHTLDIPETVYINIFSCKDFDINKAEQFAERWFNGSIVNSTTIERI
jgi:S-adenosylmethionine/arginine decarboxylase-like enzyme